MGFLSLTSALIAAGITLPLLVAMYFLKLRRKQLAVSSTLLWKKTIRDMQVNSPFQKMRRNILLLLQLLALLALLIAMARPTFQTAAHPGQRIVIVLDHSASMNAADVSPSRLARAKQHALDLVNQLNADTSSSANGAMVVSFAQNARVVQPFTSDPARLRAAIRSIQPTDEASHIAPALRLVQPFAQAAANAKGKHRLAVYVISDGRVQASGDATPALAGADFHPIMVGQAPSTLGADNVAIASFSARRQFDQPQVVQVFARLTNAAAKPVQTHLSLRIDGELSRVQSLTIPPAAGGKPLRKKGKLVWPKLGTRSVQFSFVLPGAAIVSLSQDHHDLLAADDTARLLLAPSRQLRVLLVTAGNAFLSRVIKSVGVHDFVQMTPDKYEKQDPQSLTRSRWNATGSSAGVGDGFDVIIFDHYAPKQLPPVNSLDFGAVPPVKHLAVKSPGPAAADAQMILDWDRDNPLLRYVSLADVVLRKPGFLALPRDATVLATGQQGPLMAQITHAGRTFVFTSFDVLESNWPLYVSFPVFMSNALQTLGLGSLADQAGLGYQPGQTIALPVASDASSITYTGAGQTLTAQVRGGQAVLPPIRRVGLYTTKDDIAPPGDRLAVNLLNPQESDLRTTSVLQVSTSGKTANSKSQPIRREIWPWFVWGALGVLLIEWFVYTHRMRL